MEGAGDSDASEDDDSDEIDPDKLKADEVAQDGRKKAGVPTLELDALPSSIASKMMTLCFEFWEQMSNGSSCQGQLVSYMASKWM